MKLDTEKLKPWLNEFWDDPPACMICKNEDWTLIETIHRFTESNLRHYSNDVITIPIVVFICSHCSYILSFSAIPLGVMKNQETSK